LSGWRDCIVVLMDLIGVKRRALKGDSAASALMRSFHELVRHEMAQGLGALHHAYVWNDSVLLLAYVEGHPSVCEKAMRAADDLKRKVDVLAPSYAIAVQGQAFPSYSDFGNTRVTVIKASSYAMANCFEIEAEARKKKLYSKSWYVDARIAKKVRSAWATESIEVHLLPSGKVRRVHVHSGYLWGAR
jgi:hypothetical protein